eukprot:CAMPEP_0203895464 /NCGR_PEP_ID=MMETSP0359-20131031/38320_1 /ASSEMBLY_ACC=CAM_ASM_000338 /TAXON_ID=268821 /ORGANISM="Scrippsiella Hangoei, Strain SHTV-5" /LENGTH=48 /DNA_ID= /DNA_START= /DNA_END= /DNA_ORIENTATION=
MRQCLDHLQGEVVVAVDHVEENDVPKVFCLLPQGLRHGTFQARGSDEE